MHTPGPWVIRKSKACIHVESENGGFSTGCISWDGNGPDNAALIASAPDLLAEVAQLTEDVQRLETSWRGADMRACSAQDEVARLTAVVKGLEADGVELKAAVDEMLGNADAMAEKLIAQRARVAELEAALGPLAALDIHAFSAHADDRPIWQVGETQLKLGDVRRASKVLGEGVEK